MGRSPRNLSIFTLAMINVAAIVSLKNLPLMAEYGLALIFYFFIASVVFFIPTALVSAELATGWPKRGGVYLWVKEALGPRWGFIAIWLQWIENVIWYPTILSFIAAAIAYVFRPELAHSHFFNLSVVLVIFWGFTFLNFLGMKTSGLISSLATIFGTLIPGALIILLALFYVVRGHPIEIDVSLAALLPDMARVSNVVFLVGVVLSLAGMEMSAVHAEEVRNPQGNYPKAILLSSVIILVLSVLGSLAIAVVVPRAQISLVAGVMEAFALFFNTYHFSFALPVVACFIAVGALGMVSTWIVGPSKGLLATGRQGDLPPVFQKMNRHNMPVPLLVLQAVFVTLLSFVFLFMPTVSSSYWILTVLTTQLYLLMYILMFVSAVVLRYKAPDVHRSYKIPGRFNAGMWVASSLGVLGSIFAILVGFLPPSDFPKENLMGYVGFLAAGMLAMCIFPLLVTLFKNKTWEKTNERK